MTIERVMSDSQIKFDYFTVYFLSLLLFVYRSTEDQEIYEQFVIFFICTLSVVLSSFFIKNNIVINMLKTIFHISSVVIYKILFITNIIYGITKIKIFNEIVLIFYAILVSFYLVTFSLFMMMNLTMMVNRMRM